ncbi:hypothetical protein DYB36_004986 [Aphanomyces astaci]|uniref:Uncharacterized protein n=1 Tax=Aphanomyces astaci TaxID=112090 RepID=A0A397BAE3_APHAT|nr:hypothetical protein DYB36_004986 [Aphanomyces astaci]
MPTIYCKKSKFLVVGRFRKTVSSVGFDCIPLLIVMGQDLSKQANRLSIAAVSHITQCRSLDRDDLLELRTAFEAAVKPTPDNVKKCSEVDAKGFRFLVTTMTTVASYFGDPPMTKKDVAALTADSPWKVLRLVHALLLFEHGNATGDGFVKILVALEVEFPSVDGQERRVGGGRRVDELR